MYKELFVVFKPLQTLLSIVTEMSNYWVAQAMMNWNGLRDRDHVYAATLISAPLFLPGNEIERLTPIFTTLRIEDRADCVVHWINNQYSEVSRQSDDPELDPAIWILNRYKGFLQLSIPNEIERLELEAPWFSEPTNPVSMALVLLTRLITHPTSPPKNRVTIPLLARLITKFRISRRSEDGETPREEAPTTSRDPESVSASSRLKLQTQTHNLELVSLAQLSLLICIHPEYAGVMMKNPYPLICLLECCSAIRTSESKFKSKFPNVFKTKGKHNF